MADTFQWNEAIKEWTIRRHGVYVGIKPHIGLQAKHSGRDKVCVCVCVCVCLTLSDLFQSKNNIKIMSTFRSYFRCCDVHDDSLQ